MKFQAVLQVFTLRRNLISPDSFDINFACYLAFLNTNCCVSFWSDLRLRSSRDSWAFRRKRFCFICANYSTCHYVLPMNYISFLITNIDRTDSVQTPSFITLSKQNGQLLFSPNRLEQYKTYLDKKKLCKRSKDIFKAFLTLSKLLDLRTEKVNTFKTLVLQ